MLCATNIATKLQRNLFELNLLSHTFALLIIHDASCLLVLLPLPRSLCVHLLAGWLVGRITENTTEWMSTKLGWRMGLGPELTQLFSHLLRERMLLTVVFFFFFSGNDAWILMIKNLSYSGGLYVWVRSRSSELKLWMVGNLQ